MSELERRVLGRTGLEVTALGYGAMEVRGSRICGGRPGTEEQAEAVLQEMKQQGKVRWIGCSSTLPHIKTYIEWGVFDTYQIPYSGLERQHENVISEAARAGAGIIDRGGVARGEPGVGLGNTDRWARFEAGKLDELRDEGESRSGFLLRLLLSHPHIHTTIVGTLIPEHLQEDIAVAA